MSNDGKILTYYENVTLRLRQTTTFVVDSNIESGN